MDVHWVKEWRRYECGIMQPCGKTAQLLHLPAVLAYPELLPAQVSPPSPQALLCQVAYAKVSVHVLKGIATLLTLMITVRYDRGSCVA